MSKDKKDTGVLIVLCLMYIPLFLFTLFVLGLSGIDYSCRFTDLICLIKNPGDLIFEVGLILSNLAIIIAIITNIKNLIKIKNEGDE